MDYKVPFDLAREQSYSTPFQNSSLLPLLLMSLAMQKHTPDTKRCFKPKYDYIIVGAGSAGSVVAGRLSEDPSKTVLLLEAGQPPPLLTELPSTFTNFEGSDLYWNYATIPQKYAGLGQQNRQIPCGTGKAVGGSSIVSGMVYVRGNREDYNAWEELGAHGWDWRCVLPYFLKAEDNTDPELLRSGFHARGGPVTVGHNPYMSEYKYPLFNAALCMGYPIVDSNGAHQSGITDHQENIRRGQRVSSAKAYLVPNEDRPNLDIIAGAYVTKVLISNRTARGVQFDFEGSRCEVSAKREVIISAGAIKSPQLLMLSGIGPRKTLENLDIPVIADLPVGQNFHGQPGTIVNFVSIGDRPTLIEKLQNAANIMEYIDNRTGILAVPGAGIAVLFSSANLTAQCCDLPDYELTFFENTWRSTPAFGLTPEVYEGLYGPYVNKAAIICLVIGATMQGRGYVSICSSNPYDPPVINPKYYEDIQDVRHVVDGMKTCYRLLGSPFLKKHGIRPFETLIPGCEHLKYDFDAYLECYARSYVVSYVVAGSVRMGDINDPKTVVDNQLRVKGIRNLRVVDASVMPQIIRGHTDSAVIMIAEKAADMIKECHQ